VKLIINTTDGGNLTVEDFDAVSVMTMLEEWDNHPVLTVALDTGTAYIPKTAVARIDTIDT
jgi:hypothetical protein